MVHSRHLSSFQLFLSCLLVVQASSSVASFVSSNLNYKNRVLSSKVLTAKTIPANDNDSSNDKESLDFVITNRRTILLLTTTTTVLPFLPRTASAAIATTTPGGEIKFGDESIMSPKEHGTTSFAVQENLRYNVSRKLADKICCYNRHFAELGGYFESKSFDDTMRKLTLENDGDPVTFYDSVTGKPLFVAPINRSVEDFINESKVHGWPSFRDEEVVWENVRILRNSGETVSVDGTHLGHNLPDKRGNRYCINLVSIAGNPKDDGASSSV